MAAFLKKKSQQISTRDLQYGLHLIVCTILCRFAVDYESSATFDVAVICQLRQRLSKSRADLTHILPCITNSVFIQRTHLKIPEKKIYSEPCFAFNIFFNICHPPCQHKKQIFRLLYTNVCMYD